jgi:hypothetical protein
MSTYVTANTSKTPTTPLTTPMNAPITTWRRDDVLWPGAGAVAAALAIALDYNPEPSPHISARSMNSHRSMRLPAARIRWITHASQAGYKDAALKAFYTRIDELFRVLPGVRAATITDMPLVANSSSSTNVTLPGAPKQEGRGGPSTSYISVGPTFFETMQLARSADRGQMAARLEQLV